MRTDLPTVSVIINCYNSERYLQEALESVLTQSFSDWELIFWDNRSTDESAQIFNRFRDTRFRYFLAPEHTILGRAKLLAIKEARGVWLAFLDCDDLWVKDKLEQQVSIALLEGQDVGLIYGGMSMRIELEALDTPLGRSALAVNPNRRMHSLPEGNVFAELLNEDFIPQPSAMVRRSAYEAVGGIDDSLRHAWDYDLFVKIARGYKVRAVQSVICTYRVHASNLSHSQAEHSYREAIEIVHRYLPAIEARQGLRSHQTHFAAYQIWQGSLWQGTMRLLFKGNISLFAWKVVRLGFRFIRGVRSPERVNS